VKRTSDFVVFLCLRFAMDVKSALDAMDVSAEAFLFLPPDLKRNAAVQSFAFDKRASLALEVDLTGKDLESAVLRAIRKGLTLKEVAKKNPLFASNLPCILAALTRDPSEMRFANLRVAASKLDAQQKLQLRNKVQESVLKDGSALLFAEQFRGDTLVVLSACLQDVRHAALATDPLGTQLCRIEVERPGNLTKVANILVGNLTKKRKLSSTETWSPKLSLLPPCLVKQAQKESQQQATQHTNHASPRPNNNLEVDKHQTSTNKEAKPSANQSDVLKVQKPKPSAKSSDVQEAEPSTKASDVLKVQKPKPSAKSSDVQEAEPSTKPSDVQIAQPTTNNKVKPCEVKADNAK
jgi:hypothetical protein